MKTWKSFCRLMAVMMLMGGAIPSAVLANPLYRPTNVSPNPLLTNEFYLTATNVTVSINGTNVRAMIYKDTPPAGSGVPGQIPGPLVEATVGQTIICHFKNNLTNNIEGVSIHWHGIELDNDSDGTAVTQDTIFSGQTYTYRFVVTRPGLYWYHSHMIPGTTTFGGMYGPMIIHDTNETALITANVLPPTNRTFQLVLTDISFTNGTVGKVYHGTNFSLNALIQYCENSVLGDPNADGGACGDAGRPGNLFLCNGSIPNRVGTFSAPTTNSSPVFYIGKNQRVRLQIFNESISRNAYLSLKYPASNPTGNTNLYQIGGQGGLLDNAVLNGGVQSGYNFRYPRGTVNLGSGMREDVMFYSSGNAGDVIQLFGNPPGGSWNLTTSLSVGTNYPVAFFVITNGGSTNLPLVAGSPILTAVGASNEDLSLLNTNSLVSPPTPSYGTSSGYIELKNNTPSNGTQNGPNIGDYAATPLDGNSGFGSWTDVPHPPTALWARAGDVLQLAIANNTGTDGGGGISVHPYHLHGFSMQPVAIYSANLQTNLFNFPFNQFLDTMDILPGEALVFRIKLEDRPILADTATGGPVTLATDSPTGGNVGRWLMHCHIFLHGAIGMISELVVVPNTVTRLVSSSAGTNSVIVTAGSGVSWTATANAPWLHLPPGSTSGTGGTTEFFSYDANPGATRFGTLNFGGLTVNVTQAGTNYVKAPGPVTSLVSSGINGPDGIATDSDGNVYFVDSANNAVKKWTLSNNTVSTLISGLSTPQGVALDGLGNVYVSQFGSTAIRKWSVFFPHFITTVFNNDTTGVSGIAVDAAGNVYIAVPSQHVVKKWTVSTGTLSSFTTNGLVGPRGVAVDAAGGIYTADNSDDAVKKLGIRVISIFPPIIISYWNTVVSSTYLNGPWDVAVDDGGNLYIADGFHNAIKRLNVASNTVDTLVSSGLSDPTGVGVDRAGNVYISDYDNDALKELPYAYVDPTAQNEPAEVTVDKLPVILMPNENLLPPFAPTPNQPWIFYGGSTTGVVQFAVGANVGGSRSGTLTVLGQPITINQDGASGGVGTTSLLVGPAAGSNTVAEFVIPTIALWSASSAAPWMHLPLAGGAGSGNVLFTYDANPGATRSGKLSINGKTVVVTQAGSTYVQAPGPLTTLVSAGLVSPVDLAVDTAGNVIFSDSGNNTVKEWARVNNTVSNVITTGLSTPQAVAVDGAGNVYLDDFFNHAIKKRQASDGSVITLVDDSPNNPSGLALDSSTNVYWSGATDDAVKKWTASSGTVSTLVSSGLNGPYGLDLDIGGAIYIADEVNNAIKKWDPASASLTTLTTSGIRTPWGVAVDGSGNVYVANGGSNNIVEWVAASGRVVTVVPSSGVINPTDVDVDANQNIYIADYGHALIKELPYAFVDPTPQFEPSTAGSDSLPVVLPPSQNLLPPFAPTSSQPWLTIGAIVGGVVNFDFTANPGTLPRNATITLLGQNIPVQQAATVFPPLLMSLNRSNDVFQFSFTNGTPGATYSVLFTTNVVTPLASWSVIGTVPQVGPSLWQFVDPSASNQTGFYRVRSP